MFLLCCLSCKGKLRVCWYNVIDADARDTLLDKCSLLVIKMSFDFLDKYPDGDFLLGFLGAMSSFHVAGCMQDALIIHVDTTWLCICVLLTGLINRICICLEVTHFMSVFRFTCLTETSMM
jgi:hypothetical protein